MNTFEVGQKVTLLDVNKAAEVVSVTEDGQITVKYTDDAGAEQQETVSADKLAPVSGESSDEADEDEGGEGDGE